MITYLLIGIVYGLTNVLTNIRYSRCYDESIYNLVPVWIRVLCVIADIFVWPLGVLCDIAAFILSFID